MGAYLCHIEVLRLVLVPVPRHDHSILIIPWLESEPLSLLIWQTPQSPGCQEGDRVQELPVNGQGRGISQRSNYHTVLRCISAENHWVFFQAEDRREGEHVELVEEGELHGREVDLVLHQLHCDKNLARPGIDRKCGHSRHSSG